MARKADIQYIQHYYTAGTAAKKVAVKAPRQQKKKPLPLFEPTMMEEPERKITVALDPLCLSAIVVCAVLLVMMITGLFQYSAAYQRNVQLQEYVYALSNENVRLEQEYQSGFDLEAIEVQALALGMIPVDQAQTIQVSAAVPAPAAEPTGMERVALFLNDLFA